MVWMFQGRLKRACETQHGTRFVACGMLARLGGEGGERLLLSLCAQV